MVFPSIVSEIKGGIVLVKAAWHIGFLWVAAAFQRAAQQSQCSGLPKQRIVPNVTLVKSVL
jgi:hypothetical protein